MGLISVASQRERMGGIALGMPVTNDDLSI